MTKILRNLALLMLIGASLSACTTCDLSLWFGDDLCAIGEL
ncbi:MAG: hypothetical protein SV765_17635 [Pseudomonadota bacterium]|nr:hypothetical protein [Pseudomonadota bacterium]